ncbi:MAG TPA: TonB-dependent receptor [Gemmatimonadales bacterium]|nr:TonB-dependent receptor [Gemmatimonadales bacterium]
MKPLLFIQAFSRRLLLAGTLGLVPAGALAQNGTAILRGKVIDAQTDSAVAEATVLLRGTVLTTTTSSRGEFAFQQIAPGTYALRVVAIGYQSAISDSMKVEAGEVLTLVVRLQRAIVDLPGIVVTAGGAQERAGESPASVAILDRKEIVTRNSIQVDDALPFAQGVTFNRDEPSIRGSTGYSDGVGSRVLMLLDGHPVLSPDGGQVDFPSLPIMDVDRTEIVKGAYSAIYGSNALGGVMNLLTAPISDRAHTAARVFYGYYDVPDQYRFTTRLQSFQGIDLQRSQRIGPIGVRLSGSRHTTDGYTQNGEGGVWSGRIKLSSRPESAHPWDAYAMFTSNDTQEFFTWDSDTTPLKVPAAQLGDWSRDQHLYVGGTVLPVARTSWLLRVSPYVNYVANRNHYHDNADYHRAIRYGTSVEALFHPERRNTITGGIDVAGTNVQASDLGTPALADLAAYAQDELRITDRLKAVGGARVDYHSATGSQSEVNVNPKLGIVYRINSWLTARASGGHGYRAPAAIEQYVSTYQFGFHVVPNPNLVGETAWSGEFGATATPMGRLWLDAALFQSNYDNLIAPGAAPNQPFVFQFQNLNRARVRGLDAGAKVGLVPDLLQVEMNYQYLDTEDRDTGQPLPYRSRHNFTASVSTLGGLIGVDYRFRSRVETVLAYPLDPRTDINIVDLRLGYRALGTYFMAKVSNLFQEAYVDVKERNLGPVRNVTLSIYRPL